MQNNKLERLWEEAIANFPYKDIETTGCADGDPEFADDEDVDYSEEFIFEIGKLLNEDLIAGGWIELRRYDDGEVSISGLFAIARNGDWKDGRILQECTGVLGHYDLKAKTWELEIDTY